MGFRKNFDGRTYKLATYHRKKSAAKRKAKKFRSNPKTLKRELGINRNITNVNARVSSIPDYQNERYDWGVFVTFDERGSKKKKITNGNYLSRKSNQWF